ncbi:YihY/virulence factor BrkB family protein [Sphingomonas rubra]|uniref:Membrane protein n=1 Tax=Sphingomonas rubra TaxID=634430 RepID=A0A1I5UE67_9SPHN|nr:YihY/virulence factor BrkB family protein [Sphingomonas rubra]SFP93563.1 membrane protein [Sphingomonas rubra]
MFDEWRRSGREWVAVLRRTWAAAGDNNVGLVAAGVAFYAFASIVPMLAATVLLYGLIATPETVTANIRALFAVLPADAAASVGDQLETVVSTSDGKKGVGLLVAIGIALYGATKGAGAMVTALGIAYGQREERGFVRLTLLSLAMVAAAVVLVFAAVSVVTATATVERWLAGAPGAVLALVRVASFAALWLVVVTAVAALYRFAPPQEAHRFRWLAPAPVLASSLWLGGTAGFGVYASNFGSYGATYGALSAVIVLLTWLWLSAYAFLLGGELDACLTLPSRPSWGPAPLPGTPPADPGAMAAAMPVKAGARLGGAPVGWGVAALAGSGLARLRRRSPLGVALLAGAGALAWLGGRRR